MCIRDSGRPERDRERSVAHGTWSRVRGPPKSVRCVCIAHCASGELCASRWPMPHRRTRVCAGRGARDGHTGPHTERSGQHAPGGWRLAVFFYPELCNARVGGKQ
eukprot:5022639-Prymnesium_polylepis.1